MKIGFDIGGVISKYPVEFEELIYTLAPIEEGHDEDRYYGNIYYISDMHNKDDIVELLRRNLHIPIYSSNVFSCDYEKYGNMAKAILIKELGIQIFVDDFDGYLQWDSSLGPQPILLKVMPDVFKPYWHESWRCEGGDFGRRKYSQET